MEKIVRDKKIKYLHVLNVNEPKFSVRTVDQTKNVKYFNEDEWGYVTPHKSVYDLLLENGAKNVFLEENSRTIIDDYAPYVEILFLHAWDINLSILKVKNRSLRKCVWRTWGHDVYPFVKDKGFSFGTIKHNIMAYLRRRKARKIKVIAYANVVDEVKLRNVFGNKVTLLKYGYITKNADEINLPLAQPKNSKRIMIGHSMYPYEQHIKQLERLKKFVNEDVVITLIFVYGFSEYGEKVLTKAKEIFGDKVENVTERVPLDRYVEFLNTVDVAILSGKMSSALGTLTWLSKFNKKVYVCGDGDLAKGFKHIGCKINRIEDIENQTFEEFLHYDEKEAVKMKENFGRVPSIDECCERTVKIIKEMQKQG